MKVSMVAACAALVLPALSGMAQTQAAKPAPAAKPPVVVTDQDVAHLESIIGTSLRAKPAKARKVLVFCKCEGFVHADGIAYGNKALALAGEKTGAYSVDITTDYQAVNDKDKLFTYDAVVLNNTTRLNTKANPAFVPNLIEFVKSGRGLCVIHSGADNFYDAPDAAEMVGGQFDGHPWTAGGTWAFKLDEPTHPLNQAFEGKNFKAGDEIYQQKSPPYTRANVRVLVSLDLSDATTANSNVAKQKRTDKDFAVSWVRPYGQGRVFYTSFAHDKRAFMDKARLTHILDGLQYTLGDLKVDDKPVGK
jgi:type 1 glutamine amidotransferase